MWRVTLNSCRSQTLGVPARAPRPLCFPAKAHARHAPKPESARRLFFPCRRTPGPYHWPNRHAQLATKPRSEPPETRHRCPSPGTRSGTDAAARLCRPAPSSPPLPSRAPVPPLPGCCAEWPPRPLELAAVRSPPVGPTSSAPDPPPPPPPGREHSAPHPSAQGRCFRRRNEPLTYWLEQAPPSPRKASHRSV